MLFAVLVAATASAAWADDKPAMAPPPAWVKPRAIPADDAPADGAALRILLSDQQIHFGPDGQSAYSASAVRIQTAQGLAPMGQFAIRWQPETDSVTVHRFRILRGKTVIDLLAKGPGFTILRREDNLEYAALDGALTATIQPEGLQVGDVVDIAYTLRRLEPLLQGHADHIILSRLPTPVGELYVDASWPADHAFRIRQLDPSAAARIDPASGSFALEASHVPQIVNPKDAPRRFQTSGQIQFSDFGSWAEVAAIFTPLFDSARTLRADSPLKAEIARIGGASSDARTRAEQALILVQEKLRYVFLGMNDGRLRPTDADTSWQRRFGDCKAKTALLLALLDGLGIPAEAALVSVDAGDGLDERLPAAGLFDHVIVRAKIDGKVYWLDGTRTGDRSLARLRVPPFRWALPLRAKGATLERLVEPPYDEPQQSTDIRLDATAGFGKPAKAHVETVLRGDSAIAWRYQLANLQPADLDRMLREYWKSRYDFMTAERVSARFDESDGSEHLLFEGTAKLEWNGEQALYYEIDHGRLGWRPDFDREPGFNREAPFALGFPSYSSYRETILLPGGGIGFTIDGKDVDQTLAGYQFRRRTTIVGNTLTMEANTRAMASELSFAEATRSIEGLRTLSRRGVYVQGAPGMHVEATLTRDATPPALPPARVRLNKAEGLLSAGDTDKAMAEADEASRLDGTLIDAYRFRARVYQRQGKTDKAADEAKRLIAVAPDNMTALATAGTILCTAKHAEAGIAMLDLAIAKAPGETTYLARARCRRPDDVEGRQADIGAAIKLSPTSTSALTMLARLQRERGDARSEVESLTKLTALDPSDYYALAALGGARARAGDLDLARKDFEKARSASTRNATVLNSLCWEQATANILLDQALSDCEAAIAMNADYPDARDSLGLVLFRLHRFDDAIASYDIALKTSPGLGTALYGRGLAKQAKGDKIGAAADLAAARTARDGIDALFAAFGLGAR